MDRIFLLLGSNQGDRAAHLKRALAGLRKHDIVVRKRSRVYQTQPWGRTDQPDFLNMALEIACDYSPAALLKVLKSIERRQGRRKTTRWGPRPIDIDILFYDQRIVSTQRLSIPHPRFAERPFAVIPVAEISPSFVDPATGRTLADYRRRISHEGIKVYRH